MLNICFVSPLAYSLLNHTNSTRQVVGGAELQLVTLAKALVLRGHQVSFVVLDNGQPDTQTIHGIKVIKTHRPTEGIPVLRFIYPRLVRTWVALEKSNAQIFIQSGAGAMTGIVGAFARMRDRVFVYRAASDADFEPHLPLIQFARDRKLYRFGIAGATGVFVQTLKQQLAFKSQFNRSSSILPNGLTKPQAQTNRVLGKSSILWAGRFVDLKRPDRLIEIAKSLPHLQFQMAGGTINELTKLLHARGQISPIPPNVEILGPVPFDQMAHYFNQAALLVNTSDVEGLPNTFVQAWARGTVSVSLFDTGMRRSGNAIGVIAMDLTDLKQQIDALMQNPKLRTELGRHCQEHFEQTHELSHVVDLFESHINSMISCHPSLSLQS
jgi:glycosyltransferase involved in cell wall biosynthesis